MNSGRKSKQTTQAAQASTKKSAKKKGCGCGKKTQR
jgi:hypothetical protein